MSGKALSFDLVVATVGRSAELDRFLRSLETEKHPSLRVLLVDQNVDDRLRRMIAGRTVPIVHLRSLPGLARSRNVGLQELGADIVAFPDDDCAYPPGLLARVADLFSADPALDGLTGRTEDERGGASSSWRADAAFLTPDNLWNRASAATIFLRRGLVERIGPFDERLGLGSGERWSSGEETDYLIRAVRAGARIAYDPAIVVRHQVVPDTPSVGYRDGASVGYLLRKHGYPARTVARMLVRPLGGALVSLVRRDGLGPRYYAASWRGRVAGYLGARRAKSSA